MGMRRPLGGHVKKDEATPRAYSRDELAAPLRALSKVYADIRSGALEPDLTRSGMLVTELSDSESQDTASSVPPSSDESAAEPNIEEAEFLAHPSACIKHVQQSGAVACGRKVTAAWRPCSLDIPICKQCAVALLRIAEAEEPQAPKRQRKQPTSSGAASSTEVPAPAI